MGKTRDLFRKLEIPREHLMQRWDQYTVSGILIGGDITETEDIKKRWQEYTKELYKKDLHNTVNHDGVITHLEPDILECVKSRGLRKHHYKQS